MKFSDGRPADGQLCLVRTMAQLSLFETNESVSNANVHYCVYKDEYGRFYDVMTRKRIENPMYWSPADGISGEKPL